MAALPPLHFSVSLAHNAIPGVREAVTHAATHADHVVILYLTTDWETSTQRATWLCEQCSPGSKISDPDHEGTPLP